MYTIIWIFAIICGCNAQKIPTNIGGRVDETQTIVFKMGETAFLPCGISIPKVDGMVIWFKNDEVVASYRVNSLDPNASRLLLQKVNEGDKGTYRCRVMGIDAPAKDHVVNVDVLVPSVNVSIRTDNNENFEAGTPRVLACVVYGCVPSPTVTWYLGTTMLRPNVYKEVNRGNFTVSSLTFVPSLTDDGKDLVCKVTNDHAAAFKDKVTVRVGHRPICIESDYKTIGAIMGDSETLVCIVESNPEPEQFIWTFADGRTIYTSSKQKVSGHITRYSSTLVWVPREDDFGPLYCRASNRFGEQKQPCTFSVINGGPPTTPQCDMCWEDHDTLRVQCDKNWDGGRPQTIHLEIKGPDGVRKVSRKGHELKVNSIHPHVNFTAELYATNSRGRSAIIQLVLPEPPAESGPEPFTQSLWAAILQWTIVAMLLALLLLSIYVTCYFTFKGRCCQQTCARSREDDETLHRGMQLINMGLHIDDIPSNFPTQAACGSIQCPFKVRGNEGIAPPSNRREPNCMVYETKCNALSNVQRYV